MESEASERTGNFGFLHEQKLLNTAMTRAKSWVAVVGDPVALCTVGSCSPIWRTYLKRCFDLESVQPSQLTLADVYTQSQELIRMNEISHEEWSTDFSLAPDEIIQQLGVKGEQKTTKSNTSLTYRYASSETEYETDFTEDSDESDEELVDVAADDITQETDEDEVARLEKQLEARPEIYKRCKFDIKRANLAHAVVSDDPGMIIVVNGRQKFSHALHRDEVVVQITEEENNLNVDDDFCTQDDEESLPESVTEEADDCICGEVVGILKRACNPINRTFICRRDVNHCGNMIPLDFRIPIIKVRFCDKHRTQQTDAVCVPGENQWKHYRISSRSQLFIVKLIKWNIQKFNPLGDVVGLVRNAVEKEIDFLEEQHEVQKSFSKDAMEQAGKISDELNHEVDEVYRGKMVFTIDEENAKALDDAFSVEALDDGYQFGIHIADVSARVPRDSPVDKEARKRGLVFHSVGRKHWSMLPESSVNACSLLPGVDRPTISVFITTDSDYNMQEVVIKRCQIHSKRQLTYEDAEKLIAGTNERELLSWSIRRLKEAAVSWRRQRLGNDKCYRPPKMMSMNCITARTLVEEMMITANYEVSKRLVNRVPCKSPLRHKLPEIDDDDDDDKASEYVQLSYSMLKALLSAIHSNDMELMKCLVTNIEYQPQLALESVNLNQQNTRAKYICSHAKYICSGNEPNECNWQHCILKLPHYVHFTSPIRRYIDIVVHRILLSVINRPNNTEADRYTKEDIAEICEECNGARLRAHGLKYDTCNVRLCSLLRERSVVIYAIICTITESGIVLLLPNLQSIFSAESENVVKFSSLKPSMLPERTAKTVKLRWKQRIYDLRTSRPKEMRSTNCRTVEVNPHQSQVPVKATDWKTLFGAVTAEDKDAITSVIETLFTNDYRAQNGIENLTSEGLPSGKHFCEYVATLSRACIVKVQLAAKDSYRSRPHIQLFHLTPLVCICIEHNTSVVESFSKPAMQKADVSSYANIGHYQKLWLPVLAVEAAYSAVGNGDSIIVHNVDIHWKQGKYKTTGTFDISAQFCKDRNITFPVDEEPAMYDTDVKGYMCIRYANSLKSVVKAKTAANTTFKDVIDVEKPFTWVGHCVVTRVIISSDNTSYVVHLLLKQNTCTLPKTLHKATVEWILKLVPDR